MSGNFPSHYHKTFHLHFQSFTDGKSPDKIGEIREEAKRPYHRILLASVFTVLVAIIALMLI